MKTTILCTLALFAFADVSAAGPKRLTGVTNHNLRTLHFDDGTTQTTVDSGTHVGDGEAVLFSFSELGAGVDGLLSKAKNKAKDVVNKVGNYLVKKTTKPEEIQAAAAVTPSTDVPLSTTTDVD